MTEIQADSTNSSTASSPMGDAAVMATTLLTPQSNNGIINSITNTDITTVDTSAINSTTMPLHITPQPQVPLSSTITSTNVPSHITATPQSSISNTQQPVMPQQLQMISKTNNINSSQSTLITTPSSTNMTTFNFTPTQPPVIAQSAQIVGQPAHIIGQPAQVAAQQTQQTTAVTSGQPVIMSCASVRPTGGNTLQQVHVFPQHIAPGQQFIASPYIQQQLMFQGEHQDCL